VSEAVYLRRESTTGFCIEGASGNLIASTASRPSAIASGASFEKVHIHILKIDTEARGWKFNLGQAQKRAA